MFFPLRPLFGINWNCCGERVENESRRKKAAAERTAEEEEDPYGGSTDENTDAEAEEDHPIPELPGIAVCSQRLFISHQQKQMASLRSTCHC